MHAHRLQSLCFISNLTYRVVPSKVVELKWNPLTNSSISLEWKSPYRPNGDILSYKVYVNGTLVHVISANGTNTTLSDLPMGLHQVAVSASTEAGEGETASLAVPLMLEETRKLLRHCTNTCNIPTYYHGLLIVIHGPIYL